MWQAVCERVRAGERAIAAAIVEFVDRVTSRGVTRSASAWEDLVAAIDPAATGASRLLREHAVEQLPARADD